MTKNKDKKKDPPIRPRLYISMILVMLMLVLMVTGQWDWLVVILLGFLLGNGLSSLWERQR